MASLLAFARGYFDGAVRLPAAPVHVPGEQDALSALLAEHWRWHALRIPGPPLVFHEPTARAALELAAWACWFLCSHEDPPEEVERRLATMENGDPASADLVLSRLPVVLRRARLIGLRDPLAVSLEALLRRWPLSGVLADITAPPTSPVAFDHAGLLLLYAERLAALPRPAWLVRGPAWPWIELVFGQRGLPLPAPQEPAT